MGTRVVITGLGIVSSIGVGKNNFWGSLINGVSGIRNIRSFDTSCYQTSLGGEIYDYDPQKYLSNEEISNLDRACHFALTVTSLALTDSSLELSLYNPDRSSVLFGSTTATNYSGYHNKWIDHGYRSISDNEVNRYRFDTIINSIAIKYGFKGSSYLFTSACAAGTYAIGQAFDLIRSGKADLVIAGGTESMSEPAMCGFSNTRSLAIDACKPFDKDRSGLVVAEGAAAVIVESMDSAIKRGAHIYGEIVGYGLSCDAFHMTAPDVTGQSAALAMQNALTDAKLSVYEVDYINAHGTGTPLNDKMETNAIKLLFKDKAYDVPISSIKSMIGHTFGAAGAIEVVTSAMVLQDGIIPPTINYNNRDLDCDLNYVPNYAMRKNVNIVMTNSYAFGGNNASLILRKIE